MIKQLIPIEGHTPMRGRLDGKLVVICSCGWRSAAQPDKRRRRKQGSANQWLAHARSVERERAEMAPNTSRHPRNWMEP
jgi:hypothetical protein